MRISQRALVGSAVLVVGLVSAGCSEPYEPGLGELMSLQQMRHAKLWYAGQAGNWELATYEIDELEEGFEDVVRFHPRYEDAPLPLTSLVPKLVDAPLRGLREAVDRGDGRSFAEAYDALTDGCNACHQSTQHGFNVIRRPAGRSWFGDQAFSTDLAGPVAPE